MNDLDEIMSKDPLSLTDQDINQIILYQRRQRANVEGGGKTKKEKGPAAVVDISSVLGALAKPTAALKRRF